ncbi:MAG: glycerol-3-phosphate 1-O-acyltransferase PlsY [Parasporobacterium sp.]|nr:glycerol-3-phosphate 1-O-acyltransferase PlsY [Parasporobacterium sp.]
MTLRLFCLISIVIGYGFGLFQTAYIYGRLCNIDIRKKGSGNLGATNMARVEGPLAGLVTLVGDMLKMFFACMLTWFIFINKMCLPIDQLALTLYTALGVVLGHNFPFYLGFKGGKGVSASAAAFIALLDWRMIVIGVICFFGVTLITKYVSLASISLITLEMILFIVFTATGLLNLSPEWTIDSYILVVLLTALCIFQHRNNIKRLLNGTERKFSFKKKK